MLLTNLEYMSVGREGFVTISNGLQGGIVEVNQHRDAVDQPLDETRAERCVGKVELQLLGHFRGDGGLLMWDDVDFVITAYRQWNSCCGVRGFYLRAAVISKDGTNISGIGVGTITSSTSANAEPVVVGFLVGVDNHVVTLTW